MSSCWQSADRIEAHITRLDVVALGRQRREPLDGHPGRRVGGGWDRQVKIETEMVIIYLSNCA